MSNTEPQPFIVTCTSDRRHEINPFGLIEKLNLAKGEHPKKRVHELKIDDVIRFGKDILQIKEIQKPFTPFTKVQSGPISKIKEADDSEKISFNLDDEIVHEAEEDSDIIEKVEEEIKRKSERLELVDDSE